MLRSFPVEVAICAKVFVSGLHVRMRVRQLRRHVLQDTDFPRPMPASPRSRGTSCATPAIRRRRLPNRIYGFLQGLPTLPSVPGVLCRPNRSDLLAWGLMLCKSCRHEDWNLSRPGGDDGTSQGGLHRRSDPAHEFRRKKNRHNRSSEMCAGSACKLLPKPATTSGQDAGPPLDFPYPPILCLLHDFSALTLEPLTEEEELRREAWFAVGYTRNTVKYRAVPSSLQPEFSSCHATPASIVPPLSAWPASAGSYATTAFSSVSG